MSTLVLSSAQHSPRLSHSRTCYDVHKLRLVPVGAVEADRVPRQGNPEGGAVHVQRDVDRALGLLLQSVDMGEGTKGMRCLYLSSKKTPSRRDSNSQCTQTIAPPSCALEGDAGGSHGGAELGNNVADSDCGRGNVVRLVVGLEGLVGRRIGPELVHAIDPGLQRRHGEPKVAASLACTRSEPHLLQDAPSIFV